MSSWSTHSAVWMKENSLGMNLSVTVDLSAASIRFIWDWLVSLEMSPIVEMIV